jgi:polar amino acid transport system substrate-binding protein
MKVFNVLFLLFVLVGTPALGCELMVRFEQYPPQAYMDDDQQWHGMDVDFAKALLDEAGCSYHFVRIPWGRALGMLEHGKLDMMLSVSKNPQRQQFAHFLGPQRQENIVLVSLTSSPITMSKFNNLETFDKPIAIQQGAYYGKKFAELLARDSKENSHFITIPNSEAKLSLLRKGRVSGVIEEKLNILYEIKNNSQFGDTVVYPVVIHVNPVYYAFSQASIKPALLTKLSKAFDILQKNGTLAAIEHKYDPQ